MNRYRITYRIMLLAGLLLCTSLLFVNHSAQAREGDDWVLVERFEAQLKKAQAGDSQAMYDVGVMYELGRGTTSSPSKAVEWLERAIANDHSGAHARLGNLYYEGKLVARDLGKARGLLQKAAAAGEPSAQFHLGQMYEAGDGVSANTQQALQWYRQAAQGGYYEARARINALESRREPTPARVAAPSPPRAKPEPVKLITALLEGDWQRNNRSAGFLPSNGTECEQIGEGKLRCRSSVQQRDTGYAVISYVTQSVITQNGDSNSFDIQYKNTVLDTAESQKQLAPADIESTAKSSVSKGQQTEHILKCKLESATTVTCVKDNITTQTYANAASKQ